MANLNLLQLQISELIDSQSFESCMEERYVMNPRNEGWYCVTVDKKASKQEAANEFNKTVDFDTTTANLLEEHNKSSDKRSNIGIRERDRDEEDDACGSEVE